MKIINLICAGFTGAALSSFGDPVFFEHFDLYPDGNLAGTTQNEIGQGPWAQTGTTATTPIQVASGRAQLGTSGQDVYAAFGAPVDNPDGTSLFVGLSIDVISAQAAGDYFFHLSNPAGTTTSFYDRLFARSSGIGFQFGFLDTSGTGSTITWGTTELSLSTDYRVVLAQNFVAGTANDTFSLYVDPTDLTIEANNTPYLTHTWTSTTVAETATYAAANFRQGSAANAPEVFVDNLVISKSFAEASPVPEPHIVTLLGGFALLAWTFVRRRK